MNKTEIKIGFITVSDRASKGEYKDLGGPAMQEWIGKAMLSPYQNFVKIIPDDKADIEKAIKSLIDKSGCNLVLTTGGTGPAKRDVTPEATISVCDKMLDGFGQQMRTASLEYVPTAILSRQVAGVRGQGLIINLPGKPESIDVCLKSVFLAVPKCLELLDESNIQMDLDFVESSSKDDNYHY
jgi:molybdopterin adenylyltransferase